MNKSIGYVAFGMCSLVLASFAVFQSNMLEKLNDRNKTFKSEIQRKDNSIRNLEDVVERFEEENEELVDSVLVLNDEIRDLNLRVQEQDQIIKTLRNRLNGTTKKFKRLENEIAILENSNQDRAVEIQKLEEEKTNILAELQKLAVQEEIHIERKQKLETTTLENIQLVKEKKRELAIDDITLNTTVTYSRMLLSKKPNQKSLKKIKEGSDKWVYSTFEIELNHPSGEDLLLDQQFVLKIVDTDTQEILPYLENNPAFPEGNEGITGTFFRFKGNPEQILHINTQAKTGRNYEAKVFVIKDGKEHLLFHSHRAIVHEGKVLR